MVDPLSTAGRTQVLRTESLTPAKPVAAPATTETATSAADAVDLSPAAVRLPKDLDATPPVDLEAVNRIKAALEDGSYGVDYDKLSDALFENYKDMTF